MEKKKKSILVSKKARVNWKTLPEDIQLNIQKFAPASFAAKRYVTQELLFQERIRKLIKKINEGKDDHFEKLPEEIQKMIREETEEGKKILEKNRSTKPHSRRRRRSPSPDRSVSPSRRRRRSPSPGRSVSPSRSPSRRRRRHN